MEQNRRARIVKRTPLYKRIIDAPEDYLTKVENDLRALDWDMLQEGFSWPLAVGLNLMLGSVKLGYWLDDPLANVPAVLKQDRPYYSSKSMRPGFATLNYTMLHKSLDERPPTSSVKVVEFQQDESHWSFQFPGKYIGPKPEENKRQVWELSLWNPSILSRNLFCWYSPAQVLILAFMTSENFYVFFPLSVMVALQVHFLVSVYQAYVKAVSTEMETDTSDLQFYSYQDHHRRDHERDHSTTYTPERKQRKFQYLSVPASSRGSGSGTNSIRQRKLDAPTARSSVNQTPFNPSLANSVHSEDDEAEDYKDNAEEEDEEEESEEEGSSEGGSEDEEESDADVDYDEEGEEPARPHPTNSLSFHDKYF
ncbi:hypothetical protein BGZ95_010191 [Linnemannia exigua]|uniref:Uncharacterized protein n=1 Tax=Linnemannia exigua TaxID=604196 RepID=A0AAD4H625_9FUNG|nr:hypothetical protein BGZ95_010191 [Linnemannia exigua]